MAVTWRDADHEPPVFLAGEKMQDGLIDRAIALLRSEHGRGICTPCLAELLARSAGTVHAALVRLEVHGQFTRGYATCAVCEKNRLVVRAD